MIWWYDFKTSAWHSRSLGVTQYGPEDKIAVGWDPLGNLAVAYSSIYHEEVWFDYLDMATGTWWK